MATVARAALTGEAGADLGVYELARAEAALARGCIDAQCVVDAGMLALVPEQRGRLASARGEPGEAASLLAEAHGLRESAVCPRTLLEDRDVREVTGFLHG